MRQLYVTLGSLYSFMWRQCHVYGPVRFRHKKHLFWQKKNTWIVATDWLETSHCFIKNIRFCSPKTLPEIHRPLIKNVVFWKVRMPDPKCTVVPPKTQACLVLMPTPSPSPTNMKVGSCTSHMNVTCLRKSKKEAFYSWPLDWICGRSTLGFMLLQWCSTNTFKCNVRILSAT